LWAQPETATSTIDRINRGDMDHRIGADVRIY
jgi:hypothetical protein